MQLINSKYVLNVVLGAFIIIHILNPNTTAHNLEQSG
jgi:hypothetical protein